MTEEFLIGFDPKWCGILTYTKMYRENVYLLWFNRSTSRIEILRSYLVSSAPMRKKYLTRDLLKSYFNAAHLEKTENSQKGNYLKLQMEGTTW
jgi:hypothetical protein